MWGTLGLMHELSLEGKFARFFSNATAGVRVAILFAFTFSRWRKSAKLLPPNKVNNSEVSEDKTGLQGICGSAEGPIISTVIISL